MSHRTRTSRTDHNNCSNTREFPNRLIFWRTSLASFFIFGIVENTQLKRLCVSWRSKTKTNYFRQKGWNTDPGPVGWSRTKLPRPCHNRTSISFSNSFLLSQGIFVVLLAVGCFSVAQGGKCSLSEHMKVRHLKLLYCFSVQQNNSTRLLGISFSWIGFIAEELKSWLFFFHRCN